MKKHYLIYSIFFVFSVGCETEGLDGNESLIDFITEPAGNNCSSGGYKVISGIDLNNNNTLDNDEIENIKYICNGKDGSDGLNSLINVLLEPIGDNCLSGGYKVTSGIDLNNNNILDDNEIENTEYICNGNSDIETRISIEFTTSTSTTAGHKGIGIYGFNKDNYVGVDSIIFVGIPYTESLSNHSIIELFDFTDNKIIEGSEIKSSKNYNSAENIFSPNLYNVIPSGNRDLGIRLRSEVEGAHSSMKNKCYLYLYRK